MKDVIFISHATPVDNEFAAWLATKLELCGYKVWVDLNSLDPSVDFWNTIENSIRNESCKFVFVATEISVNGNRDGIKKELAVADRVKRDNPNFIVPVRIDSVNFNDFPVEIVRLNAIDFYNNWGDGLAKLLKYLEEENVPRNNISIDAEFMVERWKRIKSSAQDDIYESKEYYYSNLFPVELPQHIYVYRREDTEMVMKEKRIPMKRVGNLLLTFCCNICLEYFIQSQDAIDYKTLSISDLLENKNESIDAWGELIEISDHCISELVNWNITEFFRKKGLIRFRPDDRRSKTVFYFRMGTKSKRDEKSREIVLAGRKSKNRWHYGLSAYFEQYPEKGIIFRWHLVFTDSSGKELPTSTQISSRRSKGKGFYNKQWRNLLKAAVYYLSDGSSSIFVNLCCEDNNLKIRSIPIILRSLVGYNEPEVKVSEDIE